MGSYATTTSISVNLPHFLEGNTTASDSIGTATFSAMISRAETEFNAVAAKRYSLPFSTVPPVAREISFQIASYYTIRAFSSRDWPNRNDMLDDFKRGFDMLEDLNKGALKLTATDGSLLSPLGTFTQSNREGQGAVFGLDNPTNWKVDKNRLDELEGSRD